MERILLIGSGGREHALTVALLHSPSCEKLWVAPGNPGIAREAECVALRLDDHTDLARWCEQQRVTLVVVGPEQPLCDGLADVLRQHDVDVFGPSKAASQLEGSKGFSKDLMQRLNIPTAPYRRFGMHEHAAATDYVLQHAVPVVIKYDGLAAGKGVVVAATRDEAQRAIDDMMQGMFGDDGVVIEGFLEGEEVSVFAICDGERFLLLAPAQDHKRVGDDDTGKNTGGMGAYAPAGIATAEVMERVSTSIVQPLLRGMAEAGTPFIGCLFCGLMVKDNHPSVVEFNVRFGDPETQAVLSVLDADVAALLASTARGALDPSTVRSTQRGSACNVVLASAGYPDQYEKGLPIAGIDRAEEDPQVTVFHAGTAMKNNQLVTNGGRVLGVTAIGETLDEAMRRSYAAVEKITYATKMFRTDIGKKAR